MEINRSRFTPGLRNAKDVALQVGDICLWQKYQPSKDAAEGDHAGPVVRITITSVRMQHVNGCIGFEARFEDTGEIAFADERSIIAWEGKT
jgi:hypothetical protein